MKMMSMPITVGLLGAVTKGLVQGQEDLKKKRTSGHYSNNSISEIRQNIGKSPEDLRRLVFTLTPVQDHELTLM